MIIAPNSRAYKGEGEYGGIWGEEEQNTNYGEMVQPSQQHVAPCVEARTTILVVRGKSSWVGFGHERLTGTRQLIGDSPETGRGVWP